MSKHVEKLRKLHLLLDGRRKKLVSNHAICMDGRERGVEGGTEQVSVARGASHLH